MNDNTQGKDQGIEGRAVTITASDIDNSKGSLRADQALKITAGGSINNRGGVLSSLTKLEVSDAAPIRTLAIDNQDGRIVAGEELTLSTRSLTGKGTLLSRKDMSIDVTSDLDHHGEMAAAGDLEIRSAGKFSNHGTVAAGATLRVTARGIENHMASSLLARDLLLSAGDDQSFINRGLIDGVNTRVQAGTFYNLGGARLYGDHLSIRADVLYNVPETVEGSVRAPVIAARERLDIGAGAVHNSEQALIYSVGDLAIGGTLDKDGRASGRAREVNNSSATINADGNLSIAADVINNHNAHFETGEESKPGNRTVYFRADGSSQFLSGEQSRLIHVDSGQIIAAENWRAIGDEDNFRLLLPSTQYPFARYGPPFDYSREDESAPFGRRSSGSAGVGRAHFAEVLESHTDSGITPAEPERFIYKAGDKIWDVFGLARPTADVPAEPKLPNNCSSHPCAFDGFDKRFEAWKANRDAQLPYYEALDKAISEFNRDLHNRMASGWTIYDGTEQIRRTIVTRSAPALITSGGGMSLVAGAVNNYASQFIAGGTVAGADAGGTALNNTGPLGTQTVTSTGSAQKTFIKIHLLKADDRRYVGAAYESQTIVTQFQLDVAPTHGTGAARANAVRTTPTTPTQPLPAIAKSSNPRAPTVDLGLPVNALYQVNQNSLTAPLVQTDPRFIGNRNWLSSDFLIRQFQVTAGLAPGYRRFGDGFYEQQLIQRQIQDATGQRYLTGFNSNEAQYLALMQAGLQQAQVQRYVLGIALSDTQIAQLKTDLVWLVKRSVTLADGSTEEVLVPQVYLQPSSVQVTGRQTLIAGNELAFQTVQDILNKGGTLAARRGVSLRADRIGNLGGRITGGDIRLAATTDIDNAGHIDAEQGLVMTAGRDIAINSTRASSVNTTTTGSNINQIASVSGEQVVIAAGRDLIANAAVIAARGDANLSAGRDISLGSVTEEFRQDIRWGNGGRGLTGSGASRAEVSGSKEVATQVSGNNISIRAGQDVTTRGTQVVAEGALQISAARDLQVATATQTGSARAQSQRTVRVDAASSYSRQTGSNLSGDTITLQAGRDANITGSNVVSTRGTTLVAGNNVNLGTVAEKSTQSLTWDANNYRKEALSSEVGSSITTSGDVRVIAGNDLNARGANLSSGKGAISLAAVNNINISTASSIQQIDEGRQTRRRSGMFSKKTVTTRYLVDQSQEAGSTISGNTVSVTAGKDVNITGSNVVSTAGTSIGAGNNVNIVAASDKSDSTFIRNEVTSGLFSGGSFGVTIGKRQMDKKNRTISSTAVSSTVGSTEGNVSINAGNAYAQTGSNVLAPKGDIDILAKKISILAATDSERNTQDIVFKQRGLKNAPSPLSKGIKHDCAVWQSSTWMQISGHPRATIVNM
ncbi:hemagglutinin repeat-containing protein [Herbaspirillum sp.]|uniref:hemagglutinin repeat-containing protein n=1 Tax=Herbaspirillum sp. TaxID=1890675 RepID=UPI0031CDFF99